MVAEGVETQEQADMLRALDCEEAQGFLFGRPVAADAFLSFLQNDCRQDDGLADGAMVA